MSDRTELREARSEGREGGGWELVNHDDPLVRQSGIPTHYRPRLDAQLGDRLRETHADPTMTTPHDLSPDAVGRSGLVAMIVTPG